MERTRYVQLPFILKGKNGSFKFTYRSLIENFTKLGYIGNGEKHQVPVRFFETEETLGEYYKKVRETEVRKDGSWYPQGKPDFDLNRLIPDENLQKARITDYGGDLMLGMEIPTDVFGDWLQYFKTAAVSIVAMGDPNQEESEKEGINMIDCINIIAFDIYPR